MLLQAQDLHSGYGEMEILHGVSMDLNVGEMVVVIGPNGAGKSTLIKTIFGLLRPTDGKVLFRETDITGSNAHSGSSVDPAAAPVGASWS